MKNTIVILLLLGLVSCVESGRKQQASRTVVVPRAVVMSDSVHRDTVDLGRIRQGEIVRQELSLRNGYSTPMVILSVSTSCGCTSAEFDKKPVQPSGASLFSFEFDSKGFAGDQLKHITLRTSASPDPYTIVVTGYVSE